METRTKKISFIFAFILLFVISIFLFAGCSNNALSIKKIEKTDTTGLVDTYTITYSDGSTYQFTITNGRDGKDGEDAPKITIQDIYNDYKEKIGDISYSDFLKIYLTIAHNDNSNVINSCLQSALQIYTEYRVTSTDWSGWPPTQVKGISISCGSGVVYKIDTDYTYIITNYHVVYNANANADNGGYIARKINGYLYGSEGKPTNTGTTDADDYAIYSYGTSAISFEYVGGSVDYDLAIIKTPTSDILAINENIQEIKFANNYLVGETAIAIGNPENEGISATQGIVSVNNEYITLNIDGTTRSYRSIRMDTSIYGGSSGGGLFNSFGELIGITNAGDTTDENINYAIPVDIVKPVVENILDNYNGTEPTTVKKAMLGITTSVENSKYIYDSTKGYGVVKETIKIVSVVSDSIAQTIGLQTNDIITALIINGKEYSLNQNFEIGDLMISVRAGDKISAKYVRAEQEGTTAQYQVMPKDIK